MIGKLISLDDGPKRNVRVEITPKLLKSELAKPQGDVSPSSVQGFTIERSRFLFRDLIRLWLRTTAGEVEFYRSRSMFDVALLLDELEAVIGPKPRDLKNIKDAKVLV